MKRLVRLLSLIGINVGFLISAVTPQMIDAAPPLQRITPQNIHLIKEINRLSAPKPTGLTWSPNGYTLAASTSADIRLYDTRKPEAPPVIIPSEGGERLNFNTTGDRVINRFQVWDAITGQLITPPGWYGYVGASGTVGIFIKDTTVSVWDLQNAPKQRWVLTENNANDNIKIIQQDISADEQTLLVVRSDTWNAQFKPRDPMYVQLWSLTTGQLLASYLLQAGGSTFYSDNGAILVSNTAVDIYFYQESYPGELTVRDAHTGQVLTTISNTNVYDIVSKDGSQVAVGLASGEISVWSQSQQAVLATGGQSRRPLAFSPDNRTLAYQQDNSLILKDLSGNNPLELLHPVQVDGVIFNALGDMLITRDNENHFRLWNAQTGSMMADLGELHDGIDSIFSPDGHWLALGSRFSFDGMTSLWEIQNGVATSRLTTTEEEAFQVSPDWKHLAYWSSTARTIKVAEIPLSAEQEISVVPDYLGDLYEFNTEAERAIFVRDHAFRLTDLTNGNILSTVPISGRSYPTLSRNGQHVAILQHSDDSLTPAKVFVADMRQPNPQPIPIETEAETWGLTLNSDGSLLAVSSRDTGMVELWDTSTGTLKATWYVSHDLIPPQYFSPDGQWLLTTAYGMPITAWDVQATLQKAKSQSQTQVDGVMRLQMDVSAIGIGPSPIVFSEDGNRFFTQINQITQNGGSLGGLAVIDFRKLLNSGEQLITFSPANTFYASDAQSGPSVLSPNGKLLATNVQSDGGTIVLWDTDTNQQIKTWKGNSLYFSELGSMNNPVFSPDTQLFALRFKDTLVWWDTQTLSKDDTPVFIQKNVGYGEVGFNADGTLLFVRDESGVSVWGIS